MGTAIAHPAGMPAPALARPPQSIVVRLTEAVAHHQAGRLAEAERLYRAVLAADAAQPDAVHLLGLLAHQRGQHEEALRLISRALRIAPTLAAAHNNLGNVLRALGRAAEAEPHYRQALTGGAGDAQVRHNLGLALLAQRRFDEAADELRRALHGLPGHPGVTVALARALRGTGAIAPAVALLDGVLRADDRCVEAIVLRGDLALDQGDPGLARQLYDAARGLAPDDFGARTGLGVLALRSGRAAEAVGHFEAALAAAPRSGLAHSNLAAAYRSVDRREDALRLLQAAVQLDPGHPDPHANLGAVLSDLGHHAEALAAFDRATAIAPDLAEGHANRATALCDLLRPEEAAAAAREALRLAPALPSALTVLGRALDQLARPADAIAACRTALRSDPQWADAHWNLALPLLRLGHYEEGWGEYEWRGRAMRRKLRAAPAGVPAWQGEDLAGRTLLVWWEQGFGDTIQFVRYLPLLAARGARVLLDAQAPLRPLLEGFPGVSALVDPDHGPVAADYHVPLMSLPHRLGTTLETIPASVPYLFPPPEAPARLRLPHHGRPRVGFAWFGSPGQTQNQVRSVPLADLAPLFGLPADWYSLQVGPAGDELSALPAAAGVTDLRDRIADFRDTAALMAQLDLVLTIDTAVAHLAGALGRPTWILLSLPCCWRYLLDRDDSPWYPTARLFRQPTRGDWRAVVTAVARALDKEFLR